MKILHIAQPSLQLSRFIEIVNQNFIPQNHKFFIRGSKNLKGCFAENNLIVSNTSIIQDIKFFYDLTITIFKIDKVILHGLFDPRIIFFLLFFPFSYKKTYWVIWGADLYFEKFNSLTRKHKIKKYFKSIILRKIGFVITPLEDDYLNAKKWYDTNAVHINCIMYESNVISIDNKNLKKKDKSKNLKILLGNSASENNRHSEILNKLHAIDDGFFQITVPLSYGDMKYASDIKLEGSKLFGDRFISLDHVLPLEKYIQLLASIDIAIFNHPYQEGLGNIVQLLGLNKKIFLNKEVSTWNLLKEIDVKVFDLQDLSLDAIYKSKVNNFKKASSFFSHNNLLLQLEKIFTK